MGKKLLTITIALLTVLSGVIVIYHLVIFYLAPLYFTVKYRQDLKGAASIGIIGSADGPTSIYVFNTVSRFYFPVFLILFIAGTMYFILRKLRRKRK